MQYGVDKIKKECLATVPCFLKQMRGPQKVFEIDEPSDIKAGLRGQIRTRTAQQPLRSGSVTAWQWLS